MAKKPTKEEQLEMLRKRVPTIMGSETFSQDQLFEKLNELRRTTPAGSRGAALLTPLYEALADPETAIAYLAPMSATKPEAVARVKTFADTVRNEFITPKATTAAPATTPAASTATTTPVAPTAPDNVVAPAVSVPKTAGKGKSVSERITELEARGGGRKVLELDAEVPAGFETVSMLAGRRVVMPLPKTATGETIPEVSQESLRKSLATRTGPDYAAMSEVDLTGRARQAQDVITGKTETGNVEQKTGAYSEYRQIQQALAAKKAAANTAAATAATKASTDRVTAYGQAYDKYQAGVSGEGDDKSFKDTKQAQSDLWKSMNLQERTQGTNDIINKSRALDKTAVPTQTPKPPPIEDEEQKKKKKALRTARSIFGK